MRQVQAIDKRPGTGNGQGHHVEGIHRWGINLVQDERREYIVTVTPEDCVWLLAHMHSEQRRSHRVPYHYALMMEGRFLPLQRPGICFDRLGNCVNAKNRLTAQAKAGKTYDWSLEVGLSKEEVRILDQGDPRRIYQSVNLSGESRMTRRGEAIIKTVLDLIRGNTGHHQWRPDQVADAVDRYGESYEWACSLPSSIGPACLAGAFAFAHPVSTDDVECFAETYRRLRQRDAVVVADGHPALVLARHMDAKRAKYGTPYKHEVTRKALYCLWKHVTGATMGKIGNIKNVQRGRDWFLEQRGFLGVD